MAIVELALQHERLNTNSEIPRGDGHSVILVSGYNTPDAFLTPLAERVENLGYRVKRSGISGRNLGHRSQQMEFFSHVEDIIQRYGPSSIVGHSLGGRWAVEAAQRIKGIKNIVCLGAPINDEYLPVPVLCIASPWDTVIPFFLATGRGKNAQNRAVYDTGHIGLPFSKSAQTLVYNFLAAA